MTHPTHTTRRGSGVTLIEMLVALAITTFMILIVNQLFNEVIATVGRGTQAGEILQRSRAFSEQIANETETVLTGGKDPGNPDDWGSRMVGPAGRGGGEPGGFLAIVQRVVNAPLTLEDAIEQRTRPIRSDQLMFVYDQKPAYDQTGTKRLPPLAPANDFTFAGDMRNSYNADYVRMWYGHALQIRKDQDPTQIDTADINGGGALELGNQVAGNPNLVGQDWVLGRHALFLTDSSGTLTHTGRPLGEPYGVYVGSETLPPFARVWTPLSGRTTLSNGLIDVADMTLDEMAAQIGTTREMVCRLLYRFAEEGAVEISRTEFMISDSGILEEYVIRKK